MIEILKNSTGYKRLDVYIQMNVIQLETLVFCRRFLDWKTDDPCGRQFDQMTQAARSGVLTLLAERRKGVSCRVYGKNAAKRDVQLAFSRYQQQYPNDGLTLTQWSNAHDRFIVCDNTVWICGASIKDAGRRMFALVKTGLKPNVVLAALP